MKLFGFFSLNVKFIYSEKATKFCGIFPLLLTVRAVVKNKGKISQNSVVFSEYMNFKAAVTPKFLDTLTLSPPDHNAHSLRSNGHKNKLISALKYNRVQI